MRRFLCKLMILSAVIASLSACKPSYDVPVDTPETGTMSADTPYDLDFVQINNDILEYYGEGSMSKIFPFIKNLEIDGDNESKNITMILDVQPNVMNDAIDMLITDITKQIGDEAQMQDFRLKKSDNESFGTVFDIYNYTIKVTQDSNTIYDQTIETTDGEDIPFNPSTDGDTIKESIEAEIASNNADAVQETVATKETAASETTAQAAG